MADTNMLYTVGAYAALIGVGYAFYHISTQKDKKKGGVTITKPVKDSQPVTRKEDRKKKQRMESYVTDQDTNKASKADAQKAKAVETPQWSSNQKDAENQEKIDNREFAKQLAKAKEGAKFNTKNDGPKQREKTVKQSKANKPKAAPAPAAPEAVPSAPSSNGADADDDESPVVLSPATKPADVSGVSDMLEPAPAGPSVLRLTDTESKKDKKQKAPKNPEPAETKKQRQNRKKAEAAKAAREETEKERKVLEEKQRRTARIAEGRAAKDGSEFMAAVNGNKNVWDGTNGTNGAAEKKDDASLYAPLDTFEKPAQKKKAAEKATPPPAPKKEAVQNLESSWISALPSEEEQMEMLKEESDEWNTVKSKSSKKGKKAPSAESGEETPAARPAPQPKQLSETSANKSTKPVAAKSFGGSFSALTVKGDDVEDDAEEEWDV
ncbi:hypothetical protein THAR02_10223 [Trichoderma harzianum]|uniref:Uncharacterized protein n=1 Tax=Trichoderma harzianum TaxID=5544 RepID=A0A0F9XAB0_TRIHA|nr:hypothetical protein THAR02_10223 [Trichoderma harzianum]